MSFSTTISSASPAVLAGQKSLVTGASKGVGRGIALALARAGADVVVNYNSDRAGAEEVVKEIRAIGREAVAVQANVSRSGDVNRMFDEVLPLFSPLTILVNNAGVQVWKPLLDLTEDEWDYVVDTNLKGCFLCTQRAGKQMRDHGLGGSIINIGSGCNKQAFPNLVSYTSSKGGMEMFTKSAATELGKYKVRVNCAAPGAIEVERTRHEGGDFAALWSKVTPMGRIGLPEDVGEFVVFLASPAAEFISGQTLWIDGGLFSKAYWPYEH
jgi:NAD(P)-dependent dehydrogenase (short-subunit alcohol dehydrogenase family)